MSRTENVTLTNMCMIKNKDQVLVLDRNDPVWPGLTFPGGHVEAHESFHDSVVREVKEETGLTISHPQLVGVKQFYDHNDERYLVFFYIAEQFSGTVKESDEGKLTWMSAMYKILLNYYWSLEQVSLFSEISITSMSAGMTSILTYYFTISTSAAM